MSDPQPFADITVLELGQFVAIPYAGQMLADGGARVIKIEPPEGEPSRHLAPLAPGESRHFVMRNRGKHSLPLDLKHPDARPILEALLGRADVVLTNRTDDDEAVVVGTDAQVESIAQGFIRAIRRRSGSPGDAP